MPVTKGKNVTICENTVIGENVTIGDNVYIDYNCIIRDNVTIGDNTFVGANSILGEYQMDFCKQHRNEQDHPLVIGSDSVIRSGTKIYGDCKIGDNFATGHDATIREHSVIGNHVSVGTLSDIQGYCEIGNHVRLHSNVFVAQKAKIKDYVWLFPHVVLTNDPTPPSNEMVGVTIESFAIVAAGAIILPGVKIGKDSLVASGAVVTKDVAERDVVAGVPGKVISTVDNIKNRFTGEPAYPWRYHYTKGLPWEESGYDEWVNSK